MITLNLFCCCCCYFNHIQWYLSQELFVPGSIRNVVMGDTCGIGIKLGSSHYIHVQGKCYTSCSVSSWVVLVRATANGPQGSLLVMLRHLVSI